jgi:hypothetical protein
MSIVFNYYLFIKDKMATEYERERLANIARNQAALETIGLDQAAASFQQEQEGNEDDEGGEDEQPKNRRRLLPPRSAAKNARDKLRETDEEGGYISRRMQWQRCTHITHNIACTSCKHHSAGAGGHDGSAEVSHRGSSSDEEYEGGKRSAGREGIL